MFSFGCAFGFLATRFRPRLKKKVKPTPGGFHKLGHLLGLWRPYKFWRLLAVLSSDTLVRRLGHVAGDAEQLKVRRIQTQRVREAGEGHAVVRMYLSGDWEPAASLAYHCAAVLSSTLSDHGRTQPLPVGSVAAGLPGAVAPASRSVAAGRTGCIGRRAPGHGNRFGGTFSAGQLAYLSLADRGTVPR